jgi:hypothetical protein
MLILAQAHEYYSKFSYKTFLNKIHGRGAVIDLKYLFDPKNKIKGTDNFLSQSHTQQVLQEIKKKCESPFYRASKPETCSKLK